jgi:hypothetical protein
MTTPAVTISMNDIRNETGDTGSISFSDWFVRHIAKAYDGPVSMSAMRGRTCFPTPATPGAYVGSELYSKDDATRTWWGVDGLNNRLSIYVNGASIIYSVPITGGTPITGSVPTAAQGYVDIGGVRYFRGTSMEPGLNHLYALRYVQ